MVQGCEYNSKKMQRCKMVEKACKRCNGEGCMRVEKGMQRVCIQLKHDLGQGHLRVKSRLLRVKVKC